MMQEILHAAILSFRTHLWESQINLWMIHFTGREFVATLKIVFS